MPHKRKEKGRKSKVYFGKLTWNKMPTCKNCWDKGFATVIERIRSAWDFHPSEEHMSPPMILVRYCGCEYGKKLEKAARKSGKKQVMYRMYES